MIGLKLQNFIWEKVLLSVLGEQAEKWQENHPYTLVLTDLTKDELKKFSVKTPLIGLGTTDLETQLPLPIKKNELVTFLVNQTAPCENKFFNWDERTRELIHKKTKKVFVLTEKENDILTYLHHHLNHKATKEELLQNVWHYTDGTESHTVESTIHTLRQKLGKRADELIIYTKTGYRLA